MRIALSLVVLAACGSKDKPAPVASAPRPLPWLRMTIDVPGDAQVEPGKQGDDWALVSWPEVHVTINASTNAVFNRSIDAALKVAGDDVKVTKQGTTADGWELRYDEQLAGDTVHFVVIHRRIAEADWECEGGGDSESAAEAIVKACATLRPS